MSNINAGTFTGNLTRDPELKTLPNGTSLCEMSIAVNGRKNKETGDQKVSFFDIKAWGVLGENCDKFLEKGRKIAVRYHAEQDRWESDAGNRSRVWFVADDIEFLSGPDAGNGNGASAAASTPAPAAPADETDDIPF